jgi:hypothetical protein
MVIARGKNSKSPERKITNTLNTLYATNTPKYWEVR